MRYITLAMMVLVTGLASGQAPQPFDLAAHGLDSACIIVLPFGRPRLEFLGISEESRTDIAYIAPGGSGRVFGVANPGARIVEIRPDLTRTPVVSGIEGTYGDRFVVDAAGNVYLTYNRLFEDDEHLLAIRPDGTIRAEYDLALYSMDLAADQCTLFYSTIGGIRRFDVCTGTALPDFLPDPGIDFKLLPDGGLLHLVANTVVRYDAAGTPTRTYTLPEPGSSLALGRAGRTMLVASACTERRDNVREYDLDTGALLRTARFDGLELIESMVAYDGFTAALGPLAAAHVAAVPSLSTVMLAVLGALLVLIAVRRLM